MIRIVLLQNFFGIVGDALEQEFHMLRERDLAQQAEQDPGRDPLDEELDIPVNEVERWRRLARKRSLADGLTGSFVIVVSLDMLCSLTCDMPSRFVQLP